LFKFYQNGSTITIPTSLSSSGLSNVSVSEGGSGKIIICFTGTMERQNGKQKNFNIGKFN